jgi:hypothetical protein
LRENWRKSAENTVIVEVCSAMPVAGDLHQWGVHQDFEKKGAKTCFDG